MGAADTGSAILDHGSSLTLSSDIFKNNHVTNSKPSTDSWESSIEPDASGNKGHTTKPLAPVDADGGAIAIFGDATTDMTVAIAGCEFDDNSATGAAGRVKSHLESDGSDALGGAIYVLGRSSIGLSVSVIGTTFRNDSTTGGIGLNGSGTLRSATYGGNARGGAVYLSAALSAQPTISFGGDTFNKCTVAGGDGGNGAAGSDGFMAADGGIAEGGAIFYSDDTADTPSLTVANSTFTANSVTSGNGGAGGKATGSKGTGGTGGSGGRAVGGAIGVEFESATTDTVNLNADTFDMNTAISGNGGNGGFGSKLGGDGGSGGNAEGGAIGAYINGVANSIDLTIAHSSITSTITQAGDGGTGGKSNANGGNGGDAGRAFGGAIYLRSDDFPRTDTWTLDTDTISGTQATSGNGGNGGSGHTGGDGGNMTGTYGGGIFDQFSGSIDLLHCAITNNTASSGSVGVGGAGTSSGNAGLSHNSLGGGLYVDPSATAEATTDTNIVNNSANLDDDVHGILGTI
jgi:hypothetical protein